MRYTSLVTLPSALSMKHWNSSGVCPVETSSSRANHDRVFSRNKPERIQKFRAAYEEAGFIVLDEEITMDFGGRHVLASHFPYDGDSHGADRYVANRPVDTCLPLLHGHVHTSWAKRGREFNVGVDVTDFKLVHEDQILEWLDSL
jgi:calcineurin-like phosphoesterase family protein